MPLLSFSLFPKQQKRNKSPALEMLAVLKATGCNSVCSQHMINCGFNLLLSFKWDIDFSLTVILRQMEEKKMLIVTVGLKTDESTCLANKHCFLVYLWVNACVLGGLQLSSLCIYCFICLCFFLFCFPMHIYLYLCDSVWNEVSLPVGVRILKWRMYIHFEKMLWFFCRGMQFWAWSDRMPHE